MYIYENRNNLSAMLRQHEYSIRYHIK